MCQMLKLKTHSRRVGEAIVANAQSQGINYPAKEEKNLPTDQIIESAWCQAMYRSRINKRPWEVLKTSGVCIETIKMFYVFPERL